MTSTLTLPPPRYQVELIAERNRHTYRATPQHDMPLLLPGVTGELDIIGGEKSHRIRNWAVREAVDSVKWALKEQLHGQRRRQVYLTENWIDMVIAEAKARPDKIKDDAADLGTLAHALIDRYVRGERGMDIPKELLPAMVSFATWWDEQKLRFVAGDTKVASVVYGYGGSLDAIAIDYDGRYVLLDWKTSNGIREDYALQLAAYRVAVEEQYGITIDRALCARFGKKMPIDFEAQQVRNLDASFQSFLLARDLRASLAQELFVKPQEEKQHVQ